MIQFVIHMRTSINEHITQKLPFMEGLTVIGLMNGQ